jgi:hypothetical protein
MIWKLPRIGDTKVKVKFVLIPRLIGSLDEGTWVWLEKVRITYKYERQFWGVGWCAHSYELL